MGINFASARKKFSEDQKKLRKEYEAAGMTPEQILALYEYDLHQFNRDIAFYRHTQRLTVAEEPDMEEEGHNPLLIKFSEQLTVCQRPSMSEDLWWLDEIEDEDLIKKLKQLSDEELDLISKLAFGDYSQQELAVELNKSQAAIAQKLKTIRKKLRKNE